MQSPLRATGWRNIVGVVGDARNDGVDRPVAPAIYIPYTTLMPPFAQFLIRTQDDPLAYLHSIRAAVASVAPDQQIANGTFTLNEAIERDAQYSRQRLFSILFGVFSAMALALALVGIFSVVAYSVAQRTTEFGVRLALGAPRAHMLWVAARIALISTAIGVAIGLALDSLPRRAPRPLDAQRLRRHRTALRRRAAHPQRTRSVLSAGTPRHRCPTRRSSPLRINTHRCPILNGVSDLRLLSCPTNPK